MAEEEQAEYEQYPAFKDVKGVRKYYFYQINIVISKNTNRNEGRYSK